MRYVSYLRVSTKQQGTSGLGLEGQREEVSKYITSQNGELVQEFVEVESGGKNDRPVLMEALDYCKLHNQRRTTVTLVIAKLDRLSRSAAFLTALQEAGVPFVAVDMPQADPFMVGIMALLARWERDRISERTKAALAAKKARGETWVRNRPPKGVDNMKEARAVARERRAAGANERAEQYRSLLDGLAAEGFLSHNARAAELTRREIPNPSGSSTQWSAIQVSRLVKRLAQTEKTAS